MTVMIAIAMDMVIVKIPLRCCQYSCRTTTYILYGGPDGRGHGRGNSHVRVTIVAMVIVNDSNNNDKYLLF